MTSALGLMIALCSCPHDRRTIESPTGLLLAVKHLIDEENLPVLLLAASLDCISPAKFFYPFLMTRDLVFRLDLCGFES